MTSDSRRTEGRTAPPVASSSRDRQRAQRQRAQRRVVWPLLATAVLVALLFLGVYPTRTFLAQRASLDRTTHQLDVLQAENDRLAEQIDALNTDTEIERIAREDFNLVRPGEEAYAILPAPPAPLDVPAVWPFTALAANLQQSG